MMEEILRILSENQLYAGVALLAIGSFFGVVGAKLSERLVRLRYNVVVKQVGTSTSDPVFGNIKVTHNDTPLRNLYTIEVEVRNDTSKDLSDVIIKAYTGQGNILLSQRTGIRGTPFAIGWSESFRKSIEVTPGTPPTDLQWSTYNSSREFHLDVLKRYSTLEFSFLCTNPSSDIFPDIWLDTPTKGVTTKRVRHYLFSNGVVFGVPFAKTLPFGMLISVAAIFLLNFSGLPTLAMLLISLFFGMAITLIGSLGYKVYDFFRKLIGK